MDQLNMNKRQSHKMVKHTQTICWQKPTICLSVFDHFVKLELKGIISSIMKKHAYTNKKEHYTKIWPTIFFFTKRQYVWPWKNHFVSCLTLTQFIFLSGKKYSRWKQKQLWALSLESGVYEVFRENLKS